MPGLIVDASIVLATVLPDEGSALAEHAMDTLSESGALVPLHWPLEIANGLLIAQRRGRVSAEARKKAISYMTQLPVELDGDTHRYALSSISGIAERLGLTAYDAAYLELVARSALPLATLDDQLFRAAKKAQLPVLE